MDGPNATPGPSRPRQQAERNSLGLDGHYEEEDRAERLREMEVSTLEEELFDTPRRNQLQTSQTPDLSKLSSFGRDRPHIPRVRSTVPPSLAALDLPSSASASDIFGSVVPPPLTRHTTYSSLPPSPRLADEGSELYARLGKRGLGISELESKLGQLMDDGVDVDEVFWPARSRRGTMEQTERPVLEAREETVAEPSLWDLLKDEAGAEGWEGWAVDGKWERIQNFLAVPLAVERVTLYGALLCLDGFLYNFTILPIRALFALVRITRCLMRGSSIFPISPAHLHSLLRMLLILVPTVILLFATDASKMYHTVRGQDTIKLYVIFNALEIADRLCCAFGQDVLDTLFARDTLAPGVGSRRRKARPFFFFALSLGYVMAHTLIYFYMLVSLNVAINSYDYTLLSLLISNQFVEIKGSVFKKFDKENLFQILCADIVERFQLSLMLTVISLRNILEMSGSEIALLPKSFIRGKGLLDSILSPVFFVVVSEMAVDWLKHAFITKFNHIRASVYGRFADVLAKDVLAAGNLGEKRKGRNHPLLLDQSPLVARRLGFASIPLACLVIRVGVQALGMLTASSYHSDEAANVTIARLAWRAVKWLAGLGVGLSAWGCLVALKVLLGLLLLSYSATRQAGMEQREAEDVVNDMGRSAVGESKEERDYRKHTSEYLSRAGDELPDYPAPSAFFSGTSRPPAEAKADGRKRWKLEDVERWTMVKRIW
ncbi:eukaryotic membrane protein family-domain-containing protein [Dioszegia hungarica]|uniref:Eukaryotic membrane protein family-domain-containing protein n=1 Tax=Dioszegia hungarica TaxID=4972 RepID=A0AA38H1Z2_9TREE|nr:eukaryotic membrane protein family-domain-containing protein [Dioszegia hungarica]KAI9632300.1 eukaryotic membrane protein family-domain-containing protein [Dioszegia hungarica]